MSEVGRPHFYSRDKGRAGGLPRLNSPVNRTFMITSSSRKSSERLQPNALLPLQPVSARPATRKVMDRRRRRDGQRGWPVLAVWDRSLWIDAPGR
jgi:hypothetical protein